VVRRRLRWSPQKTLRRRSWPPTSSRKACRIYLQAFRSHWSHRKDAFDGELEAWVDNFMRPGNLQGGFNWYRSVHAARMAVIEGQAPLMPALAPARSGALTSRC